MSLLSELKKIRVQHVSRGDDGLQIKTDVDVLTDADCITMDGGDLRTGIGGMIDDRIEELIDGAPEELDTLKEIANELAENKSGVTTIIKKLGDKVDKVEEKGLSTNDFTNEHKRLVENSVQLIEIYPNPDDNDKSLMISLLTEEGVIIDYRFIDIASQDEIGLMSKEDKKKLDDIEAGAQKNAVTSVNGQVGDVKIDIPEMDLTGYAKTSDLKLLKTEDEIIAMIDEIANKKIRNLKKYISPNVFKPRIMTAIIDQSNPDPLACVSYADDAVDMTKGSVDWDDFFESQLVLFKDGMEIRNLKDEELDSLTEADGDVMVKFPRKGLNIKTVGDKVYVTMTDNPDNPDFKYYAHTRGEERREAFYLGAYLGNLKDGKLKSHTGKKPAENKNIYKFREAAQANGTGYEMLGFYQLTFLQAMYVLKYGNLDSQKALGKGFTGWGDQETPNETGATNNKGIDFGSANDMERVRFQYIEDFYGNRSQYVDGIKIDDEYNICVNIGDFINNYNYHKVGKTKVMSGNAIKEVMGTSELGFFVKSDHNHMLKHYCDIYYIMQNSFASFGGSLNANVDAGAFNLEMYWNFTGAWTVGARLMFL